MKSNFTLEKFLTFLIFTNKEYHIQVSVNDSYNVVIFKPIMNWINLEDYHFRELKEKIKDYAIVKIECRLDDYYEILVYDDETYTQKIIQKTNKEHLDYINTDSKIKILPDDTIQTCIDCGELFIEMHRENHYKNCKGWG